MKLSVINLVLKKGPFASFLVVPILIITGCAGTRPLLDQSRAHAAMSYAKENGAIKGSPKNYRRGASLLKKADQLFEQRRFSKAKKHYVHAMKYFEKSEVRARLLSKKSGVMF